MAAEKNRALFDRFAQEVKDALPVGASAVTRLVQDAVSDYLIDRRRARASDMKTIRARTRDRIVRHLKGLPPEDETNA